LIVKAILLYTYFGNGPQSNPIVYKLMNIQSNRLSPK